VWCVGAHEAQERTQAPLQTNLIAYSSHAEAPKEWFHYPNDAQAPPTPIEGTCPLYCCSDACAHAADSVSCEQHLASCAQRSTSFEQRSAWLVIGMLWQLMHTYNCDLWRTAAQIARCHVKAATPPSLASYSAVSAFSGMLRKSSQAGQGSYETVLEPNDAFH